MEQREVELDARGGYGTLIQYYESSFAHREDGCGYRAGELPPVGSHRRPWIAHSSRRCTAELLNSNRISDGEGYGEEMGYEIYTHWTKSNSGSC
ncbi:hypothetical protein EVAR_6237_1 [Eumeta japonica]|uniref:Uncharacterized protein n=1 Tax=Eumeta variegata TaxID=151549 RepID=A0A4C1TB48_EUMVA|nr:hypothetical protein EVAR_6237_1 [Eumeta japonica]